MGIFDRFKKNKFRNQYSIAELDEAMDRSISSPDVLAMNLATVFQAATIRTNYILMPPLITYYRDSKNNKEKFRGSPIYSLLHDKPNPLMTAASWKSTMELHAMFYGNGCSRIERDTLGRPFWIWPLDSKNMTPRLEDNNRSLVWDYRLSNGQTVTYPDMDIIHIPGISFDGICGEGIIKLAAESLSLSMQAEEFGRSFFSNGMQAGGILEYPGALGDQAFDKLKQSMDEFAKSKQKHKTMILEDGMKWNKITFSPEEAQFLATRQYQDCEIARWFNVPLRKLQVADSVGLGTIEQINIEFIQQTMLPRYVVWEQELNTKLFGVGSNRFVEFNIDALLRGDSQTRANVSHIMRLDGILNADEWRMRENMNPIGGEKGAEYWGQPNLAANKTNQNTSEEKKEEAEPQEEENAEN